MDIGYFGTITYMKLINIVKSISHFYGNVCHICMQTFFNKVNF